MSSQPSAFIEHCADGSLRAVFGTGGVASYDRVKVDFNVETSILTVTGVSTSAMEQAHASHAIKIPCQVKTPSKVDAAVEDGRVIVSFPRDAIGGSLARPSAPAQTDKVEKLEDELMEPRPRSTTFDSSSSRDSTPPPLSRQPSQESLPAACDADAPQSQMPSE